MTNRHWYIIIVKDGNNKFILYPVLEDRKVNTSEKDKKEFAETGTIFNTEIYTPIDSSFVKQISEQTSKCCQKTPCHSFEKVNIKDIGNILKTSIGKYIGSSRKKNDILYATLNPNNNKLSNIKEKSNFDRNITGSHKWNSDQIETSKFRIEQLGCFYLDISIEFPINCVENLGKNRQIFPWL